MKVCVALFAFETQLIEGEDTIKVMGRTPRPAQPLPREEPPEDAEEKARLIAHVLELQDTLDGWHLNTILYLFFNL